MSLGGGLSFNIGALFYSAVTLFFGISALFSSAGAHSLSVSATFLDASALSSSIGPFLSIDAPSLNIFSSAYTLPLVNFFLLSISSTFSYILQSVSI